MNYCFFASKRIARAVFIVASLICVAPTASPASAQRNNYSLFFVTTAPIATSEFTDVVFEVGVDCAFEGVAQVVNTVAASSVIDVAFAVRGPGIDCQYPAPSSGRQLISVTAAGKPAGSYRIYLRYPAGDIAESRDLIVSAVGAVIKIESLIFGGTLRYFLAANPTDLVALGVSGVAPFENSTGGTWAKWARADSGFKAWPASGAAPASAKPVCRFFNTKVATHFYSASSADCTALRGLPDWVDEGIAFRALLPQGGVCQSGTEPVYRLFSASLANHRYTRGVDTYQTFTRLGWVGEGVAFCSPVG